MLHTGSKTSDLMNRVMAQGRGHVNVVGLPSMLGVQRTAQNGYGTTWKPASMLSRSRHEAIMSHVNGQLPAAGQQSGAAAPALPTNVAGQQQQSTAQHSARPAGPPENAAETSNAERQALHEEVPESKPETTHAPADVATQAEAKAAAPHEEEGAGGGPREEEEPEMAAPQPEEKKDDEHPE